MIERTPYDVIGKFPPVATIPPGSACERQELLELLPHLQAGDVIVLDRGYPSFEVLDALRKAGIEFVMRVPKSGSFEAVQVFQESGGDDYRVLVHPPVDAARTGTESIEVRCDRVDVGPTTRGSCSLPCGDPKSRARK